ncbi:MAG: hypothetical protein WC457_00680 [Patescibacteria group bacterium]
MTQTEKNFLAILKNSNATMGGFCAPLLLWAFKDELLEAVRNFGAEDVLQTFTSTRVDAEAFEILGGSNWFKMFSGINMREESDALRRMFAEVAMGTQKSRLARQFVLNTCRDAIMAEAA